MDAAMSARTASPSTMSIQLPFASPDSGPERLVGDDLDVEVHRQALEPARNDGLRRALLEECAWRDDQIVLFGRRVRVPRRVAWHGDPGCPYAYSGLRFDPAPWTDALDEIRAVVEALCRQRFNTVLANLYRNGADSMGWHADDEPELGPAPVIVSVSLGATRRFVLRRTDDHSVRHSIDLDDGSLLVMRGDTQRSWHHAVPRTARPTGPRVNLTFRRVTPAEPGRPGR